MGLSLYLQSQKQAIATSIALQNATKKQTNTTNNSDFSDSKISIFSSQVREAIRAQAAQCNDSSSRIAMNKAKNQEQVAGTCSEVNSKVLDLQSLISWAGAASQEIASTPGISDSAISSINQNMGATIQYGSSAINNAVSQASEALTKINTPENKSLDTVVKSVKNNIQSVAQQVTGTTATKAQDETLVNTQTGTVTAATDNTNKATTDKTTKTVATENKTKDNTVETKTETADLKTDNPFAVEAKEEKA